MKLKHLAAFIIAVLVISIGSIVMFAPTTKSVILEQENVSFTENTDYTLVKYENEEYIIENKNIDVVFVYSVKTTPYGYIIQWKDYKWELDITKNIFDHIYNLDLTLIVYMGIEI